MEGVVGQMVLHGANNMGQRIQTDDIRRAIGTRFGSPKTRAGQLVYQFVRQAEFLGLGEYRQYAEDPDTVANAVGGVFGAYDALDKLRDQKGFKQIDQARFSVGSGYQFAQGHLKRRFQER